MVGNRWSLLLDDDVVAMAAAAPHLRTLLPGVNVDALAADFPAILDVDEFEAALLVIKMWGSPWGVRLAPLLPPG
jgi:hypothetical protein